MNARERGWLIVMLVLLGVCEWGWQARTITTQIQDQMAIQRVTQQRLAHPALPAGARSFATRETRDFLAAAKKAEAMADPLQRCLRYPDPPGSHWSAAAVKAYCQYYLQPVMPLADAQKLIVDGHAAELDRRLSLVLQAQLTQPDAHGLLDHTYFNDFDDGSFALRQTLDAWKRASPSSAFAYAASGEAYVAMASDARGGGFISDTPQSKIDAMDRLLQQADADLQRAVTLDPRLTPAYVAMIQAGKMSLGEKYMRDAAARGLAAAPDNYAIYGALSGALEPRWGGSLAAMARSVAQAQAHAAENPLLVIDASAEPAYRYDVCNCRSTAQWEAFPVVFDNLSSTQLMFAAGLAANRADQSDLAAIYLSEGLRFQPDNSNARMRRNYALSDYGQTGWAIDDANRWIQQWPDSAWGYSMRGYAYRVLGDAAHAAPDLEKATTLDAQNSWPLVQLGDLYMQETATPGMWDKVWDVANHLIQSHPEQVAGWRLRAKVQTYQPRPGLDDTAKEFYARFGSDPDERHAVGEMKMMVEQSQLAKGPHASIGRRGTATTSMPARATSQHAPAHT
jgi:tetratricopeptide (TPR) repeat protein